MSRIDEDTSRRTDPDPAAGRGWPVPSSPQTPWFEGSAKVVGPRPCRDRVNADGHREILGLQVTPAEYGAGWLASFRDLTARGLCGAQLVTSDADTG